MSAFGSRANVIAFADTDPELARIEGHIHDLWFGLSRIREEGQRVLVPLTRTARFKDASPGSEELMLAIEGVTEVKIIDEAKIEWYDVNRLKYDSTQGVLCLESGFPLEIRIRAATLSVTLFTRTT